jgi:coenzyme F420 biosynthesis associated uncharacterized protein
MLDRVLTERIANAVSRGGSGPGKASPTTPAALPGDLVAICADAERRVVNYTGLQPAAPLPAPEAIDRPSWISANVNSMAALIEPLGDRLAGGLGALRGPVRAIGGTLISAEAGALTGYLSQRVLGQYEFVIVDPQSRARLLFVAPNVAQAAHRLNADPEQLLTWIAFHEVTHAVQFAGVPWLRPHLAGLLRELLESLEVKVDPRAMLRPPGAEDIKATFSALREGGLVAVLGGGGRKTLLDRIQGTMGVIEGHAEHVMDAAGAPLLRSLPKLRTALDRRRAERPPVWRMLERLLGLDLKMRQYEIGRRFVDAVVERGGMAALNRAWTAPERLPTLAELDDPDAWLRRTAVPQLGPAA